MTADEIRQLDGSSETLGAVRIACMLREIAAQLAELNENLTRENTVKVQAHAHVFGTINH